MENYEGLSIDLPFVVNNNQLEIDHPDERMTNGTLMLLDFPQSGQLTVPAHNSKVKNIAWENAKTLIDPLGSSVEDDYKFLITNTATNSGMKLEITPKGGLHGIVSQVNDIQDGNDFLIKIPSLIRNHIFNNISKGVFISIWSRKTRLALTGVSATFVLNLQSTSNLIAAFQTGGSSIIGGNLGFRGTANDLNSLSPKCLNLGVNQKTGTPLITDDAGGKLGSNFAYSAFELNKACSEIIYQIRIDYIDESGKTYAQLDAEDYSNFQREFAAGGRFYNDTFTSPSTLP